MEDVIVVNWGEIWYCLTRSGKYTDNPGMPGSHTGALWIVEPLIEWAGMGLKRWMLCLGLLIVSCSHQGDQWSPGVRSIRIGEARQVHSSEYNGLKTDHRRPLQHRWVFDGWAGQPITISVNSYEFDTALLLMDPRGRLIESADDNAGFFNPRIARTLPMTGRYSVIVCGTSLDQVGSYRLSVGEGIRAISWDQSAVDQYHKNGALWAENHGGLRAIAWTNLAVGKHFRERHEWERAEEAYALSLKASEQAGYTFGQWAVALERGTMLMKRARTDRALGELERARQLCRKLRSQDQAEAAVAVQTGDLYVQLDRPELADTYYRLARQLSETGGNPSLLVRVYTSLFHFIRAKDPDMALEFAETAYRLCHGVDPVLELKATAVMSDARFEMGHFDEGLKLAFTGRRMAQTLGCRDEEVSILTRLSMAFGGMSRIEEMISAAHEAVLLTHPGDEDPNPRRIALQMEADGEMLRGDYETALGLCYEALAATERAWDIATVDEHRQRLLSQSKAITTQILGCLDALSNEGSMRDVAYKAFDLAERSRSRTLLTRLGSSAADVADVSEAHRVDRDDRYLADASSVGRQTLLVRTGSQVDPGEISRLENQRARIVIGRMQHESRSDPASAHSRLGQPAPLTAHEVQRRVLAARPQTAILVYQLGIRESFLIVLTPGDAHLLKLADWKTIGAAVTAWREQIRRQSPPTQDMQQVAAGYAEAAGRLYELLVKPARRIIRERNLIIVPDEALHQLSFEALVLPSPGQQNDFSQLHYLIQDHAISYAPSISAVEEIENRMAFRTPDPGKRLLLVGDAVFSQQDPRIVRDSSHPQEPESELAYNAGQGFRSGLQRLPATRDEVLAIARLARKHHWDPETWLGIEATERSLKARDLSDFRLIHLATHASADLVEGEFSGVVLSMVDTLSTDDGVLTAAEASRLRLTADLVLLSACETGGGQMTGAEGLVGLSRSFLLAGARSVCTSLWRVEDGSTQQFMTAFYGHFLETAISPAAALRQAKIDLLRSGNSPFQWAPFVLVGSPGQVLVRN